jgi:hypothetical protein
MIILYSNDYPVFSSYIFDCNVFGLTVLVEIQDLTAKIRSDDTEKY